MTLDEIKRIAHKTKYVDTGYYAYLGYEEGWKQAISKGILMREYVSNLGRLYDPETERLIKLNAYEVQSHVNKRNMRLAPISLHTADETLQPNRYHCVMSRVVLETFKGPPPKDMDRPHADHINEITIDNSAENLQWLSHHENVRKSDPRTMSTETILKISKSLIKNKLTIGEIAEKYGVTKRLILDILQKKTYTDITKPFDFSKYTQYKKPERISIYKIMNLILSGKSDNEIIFTLNISDNEKESILKSAHDNIEELRNRTFGYSEKIISKVDRLISKNWSNKELYILIDDNSESMEKLVRVRRRLLNHPAPKFSRYVEVQGPTTTEKHTL